MIGKTLSHFRIVAKLGEGGMGVVYRAEDERLRRPVALKVLPPGLVGSEERRRRFLREARAAAAVTQPNIAVVHEIDEAEGMVFIAQLFLGWAYEAKGMHGEAILEFQKARELCGGSAETVAALGHAYARAGKTREAMKMLEELDRLAKRAYVSAFLVAGIYAALGDRERTFTWLEKAYEERSGWLVLLKMAPQFDDLRPDPRFEDLLRRIGFPPA